MGKGFGIDTKMKKKRKRKKESSKNTEQQERKCTLSMIPVHEKYPPRSDALLITWEDIWGYSIMKSHVVLDHIEQDIQDLSYSRIRYWFQLEE